MSGLLTVDVVLEKCVTSGDGSDAFVNITVEDYVPGTPGTQGEDLVPDGDRIVILDEDDYRYSDLV